MNTQFNMNKDKKKTMIELLEMALDGEFEEEEEEDDEWSGHLHDDEDEDAMVKLFQ